MNDTNDKLKHDLDAWASYMMKIGDSIPDFWDELNTSERLAEWLTARGYVQSGTRSIFLPGDIIAVPANAPIKG